MSDSYTTYVHLECNYFEIKVIWASYLHNDAVFHIFSRFTILAWSPQKFMHTLTKENHVYVKFYL